jgi:flagellar hook-associated protein 2
MASVTSSGMNLDVQGLVAKLVAADRAGPDAKISRQETSLTVQLSGLSSLKGALSTFQSSLTSLKTMGTFNPRTASVSDDKYFTATASTSAAPGSYDIEVMALAKAHQLVSEPFASGASAVVGTGTLSLTVGSSTFNVEIDSTNNTVGGIRDAINKITGTSGVQATVVNGTGGAKLVLTSTHTGAAHAIKVAQSGGDGGLAQLTYDPVNVTNPLTQLRPAQDAHVIIADTDVYSATNSVTGAIDGITLNLKGVPEDAGTIITLTVANDTATVQKNVEAFVTAFNKAQETFAGLRAIDKDKKTTGPLFGDAMLRAVEDQLRSALGNPVSGIASGYNSLATLGITRGLDGKLSLDSAKFKTAMESGENVVANVFAGDNGIATRLSKYIDSQLASGASFDYRNTSIQTGLKNLAKDKEALEVRMASVQARYLKQFQALDSLLSGMQQTSTYLSQQLANLPGSG